MSVTGHTSQSVRRAVIHSVQHVLVTLPSRVSHLILPCDATTGVESGGTGGGRVPRSQKISGGRLPRNDYISASFLDKNGKFCIFHHFQNKVTEIREKLNFGCRWVWVPMNPSPQTKLRGDAPGRDVATTTTRQTRRPSRSALKTIGGQCSNRNRGAQCPTLSQCRQHAAKCSTFVLSKREVSKWRVTHCVGGGLAAVTADLWDVHPLQLLWY